MEILILGGGILGLYAWFLRFGIVGAIAKDIVKMYSSIKDDCSPEKEKLDAVFGMWSHKHIDFSKLSKDLKKSFRIEDVFSEIEKGGPKTLLDVFLYALSIEADVSPKDGSVFREAIKIFEATAIKRGINVSDECVQWYRVLNIMEGKDPFEK